VTYPFDKKNIFFYLYKSLLLNTALKSLLLKLPIASEF